MNETKIKRSLAVTIFGWFLIAVSLFFLVSFPKTISAISNYYKMFDLAPTGQGKNIIFFRKIFVESITYTLIRFILFFVSGIGVLRLKRWAYYLALAIPFLYFKQICIRFFYGAQFVIDSLTLGLFITAFGILIFLSNKKISQQFNAEYTTKKGTKISPMRFIGLFASILLSMNIILAVCSLSLSKKFNLVNNIIPQKVEYNIKDEPFILDNCKRQSIFGFSVYIPKDYKIGFIRIIKRDIGLGWSVCFLNMEGNDWNGTMVLESKGIGGSFLPISKALGFNSAYDFEKRINYPTFIPFYLILRKAANAGGIQSIDEANAKTWRGFVRVSKSKDNNIYYGSLHSLKGDKTCGIRIASKEEVITPLQAESIIASVEFSDVDKKSKDWFNLGKDDLGKGDFTSAALNFLNALYFDKTNPQYAYYLAYSLFQDKSTSARETRLGSSKSFLEYALELNPDYQAAKDLLALVEEEIKQLQQKKEEGDF